MVGQFLGAAQHGAEVDALGRSRNVEVLGQEIFDVLDGGPWPDGEGALATVGVVDILDEDLEVEGGVVGKAIVMAHDDDNGKGGGQ